VDRPRLITADHFCIAGDAEAYEVFGITIKVASLDAVIRANKRPAATSIFKRCRRCMGFAGGKGLRTRRLLLSAGLSPAGPALQPFDGTQGQAVPTHTRSWASCSLSEAVSLADGSFVRLLSA
jgi:hypothetical protein